MLVKAATEMLQNILRGGDIIENSQCDPAIYRGVSKVTLGQRHPAQSSLLLEFIQCSVCMYF